MPTPQTRQQPAAGERGVQGVSPASKRKDKKKLTAGDRGVQGVSPWDQRKRRRPATVDHQRRQMSVRSSPHQASQSTTCRINNKSPQQKPAEGQSDHGATDTSGTEGEQSEDLFLDIAGDSAPK
jgi:hypothetical protein